MLKAERKVASPLLEICVDNVEGLFAAIEGGADRIELCSALSVGGLTPSYGFMELAGRQAVPVMAMIRPRAGGFIYSTEEVEIMKADIDAARAAGLAGIVLGAATLDNRLDRNNLTLLCRHAEGMDLTLHRAFDVVENQSDALEMAVDLGFSRILTSGGKPTALEGKAVLAQLIDQSAGRISIMPGAGIRPSNAQALLLGLSVYELHASCSMRFTEENKQLLDLSFAAKEMLKTDAATVKELKSIFQNAFQSSEAVS
ncbi:copper homeostasis protein CutC [Rhizobium helianthi]|uniref:PF03932 family protein CutC n=1 Tax=Rhizobium helianthi TaxID=1132695 RepID=A0ABW4M7V4_9HYPH